MRDCETQMSFWTGRRAPGVGMIRATDFHTYYQLQECSRRLWLDANQPDLAGEPGEFEELMLRRGQEHERVHLATFPEYVRPVYPHGDLAAGVPDFLIRERGRYVVRDAKLALNLDRHPEIPAQMALYARLFKESTRSTVVRAEVVLGNGELAPVDIADVDDLTAHLARIKSARKEPDEAVGWTKCNSCSFSDHCWEAAVLAHDPGVVPGIEQGLRNALVGMGIMRYDDLLGLGAGELAEIAYQQRTRRRQVGQPTAERVLTQVRVLLSRKMEIISPPERLPDGPVVYFDIESNPVEMDLDPIVYLWGLLIDRGEGSRPEYWGEVSGAGPEADASAWKTFLKKCRELTKEFGRVPFVHYSHYEKTWVTEYARRWGDPQGTAAKVLSLLWDMEKRAVRGHLCLPVYSYGLKRVEEHAGFRRSQEGFGALWSVARYNACLEAQDDAERKDIEQELLTYNREDCVAMRHVLRWIRGLRAS